MINQQEIKEILDLAAAKSSTRDFIPEFKYRIEELSRLMMRFSPSGEQMFYSGIKMGIIIGEIADKKLFFEKKDKQ